MFNCREELTAAEITAEEAKVAAEMAEEERAARCEERWQEEMQRFKGEAA